MSSTSPFLVPTHMDDPFPRLAKLRAQDPVHFVPELGFWVILRHDDVKRLFADNEHVNAESRVLGAPSASARGELHAVGAGAQPVRGAARGAREIAAAVLGRPLTLSFGAPRCVG